MQQYTDSLPDIGTVLQLILGDGSRQEAYGQYRRGGDLETVARFMRDCRKHESPETFLEWKYILFEFNDSDEDVLRAEEIGDDVGVDSLLFIITNSKWKSRRFTVDGSQELPLRSHFASVSPAAAMNATAIESNSFQCQETQDKGSGSSTNAPSRLVSFLPLRVGRSIGPVRTPVLSSW